MKYKLVFYHFSCYFQRSIKKSLGEFIFVPTCLNINNQQCTSCFNLVLLRNKKYILRYEISRITKRHTKVKSFRITVLHAHAHTHTHTHIHSNSYCTLKITALPDCKYFTIFAPKAIALKISIPHLTPPSRYMSHLSPTAFAISGRTSICTVKNYMVTDRILKAY